MLDLSIRPAHSALEREQAFDIRRTVLCGELHLGREAARDPFDEQALILVAWLGEKPVATGRMVERAPWWVLEHLAVLGPWRRQGIGRALLAAFRREAEAKSLPRLLAVGPSSALPFLQAGGFRLENEDDGVVLTAFYRVLRA
ncbi:MAG TPA: GNAT family N-acetyltransferase [bacterium]|jgi:GNAT superfamily N-acetyltransferase|nr:GNAT family N-acetyltransferase [bacterium]